jgi:NADH dehydrogenase [ubiquinone] 1 alpha subcomplex assembly factor 5
MSGGESGPPRLFDPSLRARRRARFAARFAEHDILHAYAAGLVAEKLLDVNRSFQRARITGDAGGAVAAALPHGKLGEIVTGAGGDGFDLIVSLLELHAENDPIGAMIQAREALTPDGMFIAVMFGAGTLVELRAVLADAEIESDGGLSPRVFPFADVRDAGSLLQRAGFALPVADGDRLSVRYAEPIRLLADLRGAGESNVLTDRRRSFLKRGTLLRALQLYRERYAEADGRVPATFMFLTMTGWRPDASQQKPLKPGAGQVSLVEALKPRG